MLRSFFFVTLFCCFAASRIGFAVDDSTQKFLQDYCLSCHGEDAQEAGLRVDQIAGGQTGEATWLKIFEKIRSGEMPPKDETQPNVSVRRQVVRSIETYLTKASAARQHKHGRVVLRRLNRVEYENTIRDLLEIHVDVRDLLPEDNSSHGFDNIGEALNVSSVLMERYLEAADVALDAAIVKGPRPETKKKRYSYLDERRVVGNKNIFVPVEDGVAMFNSGYSPTALGQFRAPVEGWYRFRFSARAHQTNENVMCRAYAGNVIGRDGHTHLIDYWDIGVKPTVVEFTDRLLVRDSIRIVPYGTGTSPDGRSIYAHKGAKNFKHAGMVVQWVEVEGPLIDQWPPKSVRRVFGDLQTEIVNAEEMKRNRRIAARYEFVSRNPQADAKQLLTDFLPRAFRRDVSPDEVQSFLELFQSRREQDYSFEEAMRVAYKAVLSSPEFLFLIERGQSELGSIRLTDYELASRLSYFLWSTTPDERLLELARKNKLHEPEILRGEVERMLKHPKFNALTKNFLGQWLNLREIEFTTPDRILYPEFDENLQHSMVQETELFFNEILQNNLSLLNFIDSDFAILNERLARHYGIDAVHGQKMRKVALLPEDHRGGVLTQASVLKVTANGTNTSPVLRGVWIMDNILGEPSPPPPANVPAVEPDIRGATTIRRQLAKHRNLSACASCHKKIDPLGFALENYDVIGGWRDFYRSVGEGDRLATKVDYRTVRYRKGPDVDSGDVSPDGRGYKTIEQFKKLLMAEKEQVARCLTEKLLTYGTGSEIEFADRTEIDQIVGRIGKGNYGLRNLVHEVVQSKIFQSK